MTRPRLAHFLPVRLLVPYRTPVEVAIYRLAIAVVVLSVAVVLLAAVVVVIALPG
jgi:type IV secretory pathway component VirB8